MRWIPVLIGAVLAGLVAAGVEAGALGSVAFLNQPLSVRQMGMGNLSAVEGDPLRAWSNPAMLATQSMQGMVGMSGAALFDGGETAWGMGFGYLVRPDVAVGLLASSMSVSVAEVDALGDPIGRDLERDGLALGPAVAVQLGWLGAGAALKYVSESTAGEVGSGLTGDAGISVRLGPCRVAGALRNLGLVEQLEGRAGAALLVEPVGVTLGLEHVRPGGRRPQTGFGVEWRAAPILLLRAGFADCNEFTQALTLGLSASYHGIGVDYAFGRHPLGINHRVSLSWSFGEGCTSDSAIAGGSASAPH